MELLIIAFLAMGAVGAVSLKNDADKRGYITYGEKQTRLIQQTREVVEKTEIIKEWSEQ